MRNLTCIVCPVGCSLVVEEAVGNAASKDGSGFPALTVTGNRCPRGAVYAREEVRAPKRTVTATCAIAGGTAAERGLYAPRRVPVKTTAPCPRERIPALLAEIHQTTVTLPVKAGDIIIAGWQDEGFDVIAVRTVS
jgi:CxxC motif-containing protein